MNAITYTYLAYLGLTIGVTVWVGRTLRRNGTLFLVRADADLHLAEALSHLLIVGFYLVNFGIISFALKSSELVRDAQTGIEMLSTKVGVILVALGGMHFFLLMIFAAIKQGNDNRRAEAHRRHAAAELSDLNLAGR